jgi:hypothetical protein
MINLYNSRGQYIGVYDEQERVYHTKRYVKLGQVFLRKVMFEGNYKEKAIAIDRDIIEMLQNRDCRKIIFTVIGLEKGAVSAWIRPEDVKVKGVLINYDKKNEDGSMTNYGTQYVISLVTDCVRLDLNQSILIGDEKWQ